MFQSGYSEDNSELANVGEWRKKLQQDLQEVLLKRGKDALTRKKEPVTGGYATNSSEKIRYVVIEDTPYLTYRGVLAWITHRSIDFTLLEDQGSVAASSDASPTALDIYKLAHQLQMEDLIKISLAQYASELTSSNAASQLFSAASYLYPDVRQAAMAATISNWAAISGKDSIMASMQSAIATGGSHAEVVAEIVVELMKKT